MDNNSTWKFKIDEKIMNHLLYYQNILELVCLNAFLKYVKENENGEYEFIYTGNIEKKDILNIVEVKLLSPEKIKFDTANRIEIVFEGKNKNRFSQIWKCGKFFEIVLKNLLNLRILEQELFIFISIVLGSYVFSCILKNENLKIKKDENVTYYYDSQNHFKGTGSLSKSCMNDRLYDVEFYNIIENVNIIAVVNSSDKVLARALLWNTNKGLYLDRCYMVDDIFQAGFYQYVTEKYKIDYFYDFYRHSYSSSPRMYVLITKDEIDKLIEYYIYDSDNQIPYFDTFSFSVINPDGTISLVNEYIGTPLFSNLLNVFATNLSDEKKFLINISSYKDYIFLSNFLSIDMDNVYDLTKVFNVEYFSLYLKNFKKLIVSGYLFSLNTLPYVIGNNKVRFFLEDASSIDNYDNLSLTIKYNIMENINYILENSNYEDYIVYAYNLFDITTDTPKSDDIYIKEMDSIKNEIDFLYVHTYVDLLKDILDDLYDNENNSILFELLRDFYVGINLNNFNVVIFKDMKNRFINTLTPGKIINKSEINSPYKKYLDKLFGNFTDIYLHDINVETEVKKLYKEVVIFNCKFDNLIYYYEKYFDDIDSKL